MRPGKAGRQKLRRKISPYGVPRNFCVAFMAPPALMQPIAIAQLPMKLRP